MNNIYRYDKQGDISSANHNFVKIMQTMTKKSYKFKKNHTSRWYDDTQYCKISYPNSTSSMRYKKEQISSQEVVQMIC